MVTVLKTVVGVSQPQVRILSPPPLEQALSFQADVFLIGDNNMVKNEYPHNLIGIRKSLGQLYVIFGGLGIARGVVVGKDYSYIITRLAFRSP